MKKKYLLLTICLITLALTSCKSTDYSISTTTTGNISSSKNEITKKETTTEPETTIKQETTTELETEPKYSPVSLSFTGDIFFSDSLYGYYQENGTNGFLSENVIRTLKNADLYIADHEFVCSDRGEMAEYQIYTFRAPSNREVIFKEMGADIVTLANNHTLDYGVTALQDTFKLLNDLDIDYVGAGNTLQEALEPSIKEINGKKIAVFGTTRCVPQPFWSATDTRPGLLTTFEATPNYPMICEAITKAQEECDYVAVYIHYGEEKTHTVQDYQREVAYKYIDAGADLVVGTHPHVLQGLEFYKGKPIMYSMGNFLFSNYHSDTAVLNITINEDNSSSVNILPCSSQLYKTTDVTGDVAKNLLDFIESISFNVEIDDNGNVTEKK